LDTTIVFLEQRDNRINLLARFTEHRRDPMVNGGAHALKEKKPPSTENLLLAILLKWLTSVEVAGKRQTHAPDPDVVPWSGFRLASGFRGCLVSGVKNFRVSHQMFHGMSEGMFGY
jgi:hypothetical protein